MPTLDERIDACSNTGTLLKIMLALEGRPTLAGRLDRDNLASAMELPRKGAAGDRVAVEQAFVLCKITREQPTFGIFF